MKKLLFVLVTSFLFTSVSIAAEKYLITMPGPKASLAKSFKSLGEGKYEFALDTTKKIKKGPLTFDVVKKSLLKKKMITSVEGTADKMIVSYKGDEAKFLKKISKTRIKYSAGDMTIAMEGSMSDGSVRARTAVRSPEKGEVRGKIIAVGKGSLKVVVQKKGPANVPADLPMLKPISIATSYNGKVGKTVFFKPKKVGNSWKGIGFKDK